MLTVKKLEKSFWSKILFQWWDFSIWNKVKVGLVWTNWSGKSTLLKILAWEDKDYTGQIAFDSDGPLIGYMKQQVTVNDWEKSLKDFLREYVGIDQIETDINLLLNQLENEHAMRRYWELYEIFEKMWGYSFEALCETTLNKLWLWKYEVSTKINRLSWWEKNKLLLCATLLKWWDFLLLDEPTNNLDSVWIEWLTSFLRESIASALIISHDRDFLNSVITKIIEIDDVKRQIIEYGGNYDYYYTEKVLQYDNELQLYQKQQAELEDAQRTKRDLLNRASSIVSKGNKRDNDKWDWSSKVAGKLSKTARILEERAEKAFTAEKPGRRKPLELILESALIPHWGIEIQNIRYRYLDNANFCLSIPTLYANPNDKILISWDNWQGKSTFIKVLMWEVAPDYGSIKLHPSIKIGYFSQDQSGLDSQKTPISYLESKGNFSFEKINFILAKLWFEQDDRNKRIELLSPWMKSKIIFALISLSECNCLIFDEPTNHIDIETIKQLEKVINNFNGIIMVVTHDKKFINEIQFNKELHFNAWRWKEIFL